MSNGPMNMDEAHFLLDKWYQEARENPNIYNPVAYSLYQVWKIADCRKGRTMYDEPVKRLRELASITEYCEIVDDCGQCSKEDICLSSYYGELLGCIEDAPTIIEAEGGET